METKSDLLILLHGFIRSNCGLQNYIVPQEILKEICKYLPIILINLDSNILDIKQKWMLMKVMDTKNVKITNINKLFEFAKDRNDYMELTNGAGPSLTIIKTNYNHIFGAFFTKKFVCDGYIQQDHKSFLFVLQTSLKNQQDELPKIYEPFASQFALGPNRDGPHWGADDEYPTTLKCWIRAGAGRVSSNGRGYHIDSGQELCGGDIENVQSYQVNLNDGCYDMSPIGNPVVTHTFWPFKITGCQVFQLDLE